ncbi:MAG: hypothetical protein ACR2IL_05235 [Chitinophagaceae bacterium]
MTTKIDGGEVLVRFKGELNYLDISNQLMIDPLLFRSIAKDYINFILIKLTNISYKHYLELGEIILNKKENKSKIESIQLSILKENPFFYEDAKKLDLLINQAIEGDFLESVAKEHQLNAEKITYIKYFSLSILNLFLFKVMTQQKINGNGLVQKINENKEFILSELPGSILEITNLFVNANKVKKAVSFEQEKNDMERKANRAIFIFITFLLFISWLFYIIKDKKSFFWKMNL